MSVKVKFDSSGGNLDQETQKQADSFERLRAAERRARVEAQELNQLVKKGAKSAATATSDHKRQVEILNRAVKAGAISQKEYRQSLRAVNRELQKGQQVASGFQTSALASITALTGFGSVQGILSGVVQVFSDVRRAAEEAASETVSAIADISQLAQISNNKEDFQRLSDDTRLFQSAGLSKSEASKLAFATESTGVDKELFQEIASSGLVSIDGLITLTGSIDKLSKNFENIGNDRIITAKGFAAAAPTEANIQAITKGASFVASSARSAGLNADETLAAISTLSQKLPSPDIAATRLKAFLNKAGELGITGESLSEILANAEKRFEDSGQTGSKFFSAEGFEGFSNLVQSQDILAKVLNDIQSAGEDQLRVKLGVADADVASSTALDNRRASGDEAVSSEALASRENLNQAIEKRLAIVQRETGTSELSIRASQAFATPFRFLGSDPGKIRSDSEFIRNFEKKALELEEGRQAAVIKQIELLKGLLDKFKRLEEIGFKNQKVSLPGGDN